MRHARLHHALMPAGLLAATAVLAIACGDDDAGPPATDVDAGISREDAPSVVPDGDAGPEDAGSKADADAALGSPIVPQTTGRIANAINPYGLLFASDGFLYVSGATMDGLDRKLAVWRYKDGVLDAAFGAGGVVTLDIPGTESSFDIVEVSAGNFVVQATTSGATGAVYLVKLTGSGNAYAFGTPVPVAFGWTDGDYTAWFAGTPTPTNPPAYTNSWGISLDKTDPTKPKIVVFASGAAAKVASGTQRTDNDHWIARVLASDLAPDPAFNGGKAFSMDGDNKAVGDNSRRGWVHADGSITSAGYANFGAGLGNHVILIRLKADGTVNPAFGFGTTAPIPGQAKLNPFVASGGFAEAYGMAVQSSGRIVTTGYGTSNFDTPSKGLDLVTFGVKADGLDPTYGRQGSFAWQSENDRTSGLGAVPYTERGRDVAVLADDRLVHAGAYDDYAALFVTDRNGKPDPSVGSGGMIDYGYPANLFRVVASADGKQLAATGQSVNVAVPGDGGTDAGTIPGSLLVTLKVGQ